MLQHSQFYQHTYTTDIHVPLKIAIGTQVTIGLPTSGAVFSYKGHSEVAIFGV